LLLFVSLLLLLVLLWLHFEHYYMVVPHYKPILPLACLLLPKWYLCCN
jgi:hypothetical protein